MNTRRRELRMPPVKRPHPLNSLVPWLSFSAPPLLALAVVLGCAPGGPKTVPVTGTVTLDGTPVAGAAVMLVPPATTPGAAPKLPASAVTDEQGRFALKTANAGAGVLPGKYQVTVIKHEVSGMLADKQGLSGGVAPGGIQEKWIVPQKYAAPQTSGLSVEVKAGMEPMRLDLKSR